MNISPILKGEYNIYSKMTISRSFITTIAIKARANVDK